MPSPLPDELSGPRDPTALIKLDDPTFDSQVLSAVFDVRYRIDTPTGRLIVDERPLAPGMTALAPDMGPADGSSLTGHDVASEQGGVHVDSQTVAAGERGAAFAPKALSHVGASGSAVLTDSDSQSRGPDLRSSLRKADMLRRVCRGSVGVRMASDRVPSVLLHSLGAGDPSPARASGRAGGRGFAAHSSPQGEPRPGGRSLDPPLGVLETAGESPMRRGVRFHGLPTRSPSSHPLVGTSGGSGGSGSPTSLPIISMRSSTSLPLLGASVGRRHRGGDAIDNLDGDPARPMPRPLVMGGAAAPSSCGHASGGHGGMASSPGVTFLSESTAFGASDGGANPSSHHHGCSTTNAAGGVLASSACFVGAASSVSPISRSSSRWRLADREMEEGIADLDRLHSSAAPSSPSPYGRPGGRSEGAAGAAEGAGGAGGTIKKDLGSMLDEVAPLQVSDGVTLTPAMLRERLMSRMDRMIDLFRRVDSDSARRRGEVEREYSRCLWLHVQLRASSSTPRLFALARVSRMAVGAHTAICVCMLVREQSPARSTSPNSHVQ